MTEQLTFNMAKYKSITGAKSTTAVMMMKAK
jgi:hypothetical protein